MYQVVLCFSDRMTELVLFYFFFSFLHLLNNCISIRQSAMAIEEMMLLKQTCLRGSLSIT